ncbi:hypothetical protein SASPL_122999 [Salvia splendens]|uniref:Uncharacterized protein n=1 Tax=Salvia splendens TaxID=180675 RepID=A0A8X8ZT03_SALSN|nr:uncharacterized protein LOC121743533 [Salvia splendens]KAG6415586.1 hypothetical protein SASPL_122999 [Salvia splendens]
MIIKSEPATTNSIPAATGCSNCGAHERHLLHQIRCRSGFKRVCTTCVLRLHPQAFCPTCFLVYPPTLPNDVVRACDKCYSHSHSHCVDTNGAPPPKPYVCPLCVNPNAPIFKLKSAEEANLAIDNVRVQNCRVMDREAAKMLLAAAKIATTSMNKAVLNAKNEAEKRVKEAAYTRKRAKEALEHVALLVHKEKARRKEVGLRDVAGRGYGGIATNGGGYTAPPVKFEAEVSANHGVRNRNGVVPSISQPFVAVEEKMSSNVVVNVDRDNSNQVLAALTAVELKENEKMGIGMTAQAIDGHAQMDVDEGGMRLNVGENAGLIENSTTNRADMETDAGDVNNHGEKQLVGMNNEVNLVQPGENSVQNKEMDKDGEHVNGGRV